MTVTGIPAPHAQTLPQAGNACRCVLLLALLAGSFVLADAAWQSAWPWPLRLAAVLLLAAGNGILLIGFGVLAHEAVHRVLFRNAFANAAVGGVAAALMLTPFHANRQFHLTHHSHAHQPGLDPENAMHDRPFWQAMTLGSLVGLWLQYRILLRTAAASLREARYRRRVLLDVAFLAVAAVFYLGLPLWLGLDLRVTTLATLLVFPPVFGFRALSDHYGLAPVQRKSQQRREVEDGTAWQQDIDAAQVTGWVVRTPRWLEWLWCHVNYHEVHHKYPWLAHSHLPAVFAHTREAVPYRVVDGYWRSLRALHRLPYYPPPA